MISRNMGETVVGAIVLGIAIIFAVFLLKFSNVGFGAGQYTVDAKFRSAEGITVGTDVRLAGVKIGSVSNLSLDPQTFQAIARLSIKPEYQMPDDSAAIISSEGLLGGSFVEILPGGSYDLMEDGSEFGETQGAVSFISLLMKFVTGKDE
jgi:phospholipid/cholesterol/gamma-HCH transport system substrate-binding protein